MSQRALVRLSNRVPSIGLIEALPVSAEEMADVADADPAAWEPLPGYMELIRKTAVSVHYFAFNASNCYGLQEDWRFGKSLLLDIPRSLVLLILVLMASMTVTRALMSAWIFEPLARWLRLTPSDSAKFPESAWKLLVYCILWTFSFEVVVISARHDYLQRPSRIWNFSNTEDHYSQPLPRDIYWMYVMQIAFYLHSVYATMYMDVWRKDSLTMLFHHGITIFLLQFSFLVKYHKIGSLVLFIHDISDVFLEFTKINVYLKHRGRRFHVVNDILSSIGFVAFAGSWAFFRLYWFPLKVLYSVTWGVYIHQKGTKGPRLFFYFNLMLWLLLVLHIYWFWFILVLLYRIATGQMKELDDTREYDSGAGSSGEESAAEQTSLSSRGKSHGVQNGDVRLSRKERSKETNGSLSTPVHSSGDGVRQRVKERRNGTGVPAESADTANGCLVGQEHEEEAVEEVCRANGVMEKEEAGGLANGTMEDGEVPVNGTTEEERLANGRLEEAGDPVNGTEEAGEEEDEDVEELVLPSGDHLTNGSPCTHSKE